MYSKSEKEKIEKICQMILEISSGNFSYRIERSGHDDQLESVIVLLNMMAEEIRESFHHFAMINPHETYQQIAQMTFILDQDFRIRNFNATAEQLFNLKPSEIYKTGFETYLTPESQAQWAKEMEELTNSSEENFFHCMRLFFASKNSLTVPALCSISPLLLKKDDQKLYFVSALQTLVKSRSKEEQLQKAVQNIKLAGLSSEKNKKLLKSEADKRKIQEVYDYILNNLEKPLPSLRELAHRHGTNEFKLKVGFRQLYDTSVFKFQKEQRLKRAHSFIVNSDLSLSRIAALCGFKSFPHFSRVFKNRYGYNPSELQKKA